MSDPTSPPPDWRDARRQERYERRAGRDVRWGPGGPWIAGVILIVIGVIFLAQNFGYPVPRNWWAVFIFVPAFVALSAAWSMYQRNGGNLSQPVTSALGTGLVFVALAVVLLMGVDLGKFWPVILIALGVAALLGGRGRWGSRRPPQP